MHVLYYLDPVSWTGLHVQLHPCRTLQVFLSGVTADLCSLTSDHFHILAAGADAVRWARVQVHHQRRSLRD